MNKLDSFVERLKKIGIKLELISNFPWIYLYKVNNNVVKEKLNSNYGFTVAFSPIRENQNIKFTDISKIFKIIRKYL